MKKFIVIALFFIARSGIAQTDKTWAFGLQCGIQGNSSVFTGGSDVAAGQFEHNSFGSGSFLAIARYDYNSRWMFMTGFGFVSYGFEFSRKVDYYSVSRLDDSRNTTISNEFGAVEIPAMVFYKFRLNCRNARWLIGAGLSALLAGQQQSAASVDDDTEGNNGKAVFLKSEATANDGAFGMLRFAFNRERILKKGGIIQAGLLFNFGFRTLANATVHYQVDGQNFSHTFSNSGNFVGIRACYFFRSRRTN